MLATATTAQIIAVTVARLVRINAKRRSHPSPRTLSGPPRLASAINRDARCADSLRQHRTETGIGVDQISFGPQPDQFLCRQFTIMQLDVGFLLAAFDPLDTVSERRDRHHEELLAQRL